MALWIARCMSACSAGFARCRALAQRVARCTTFLRRAILKISLGILAVVLGIRQTCIRQRKTPFGIHILVPAYRTMGANSGCQSYSTAIMKMCKEV
ncbi:hypothetical protein CRG98_038124 [Punica granatum]|uniref:Uncharacterized protein n=1 Tax=Punica granatum TaxID=22663 RepID=A0A2I0IBV5_PUNGR|nr:hypothetical protein CRG98_038124 [Punica granatum]